MTSILGTFHSTELPDDLRPAARALSDRKVIRLLEEVSLGPFIAAVSLLQGVEVDPERLALYTVSNFEPVVPYDDGPGDPGERLARSVKAANPIDWLRWMANNTLCQIAIVARVQGPNMHFVGAGDAVRDALLLADAHLTEGRIEAAAVVGFDDLANGNAAKNGAAVLLATEPGESVDFHTLLPRNLAGMSPRTVVDAVADYWRMSPECRQDAGLSTLRPPA